MASVHFEVLLVEDDPGDIELTRSALKQNKLKISLSVAEDGEQALDFLRRKGKYANAPRPDLILLDLNMPRKDGREVLAEIKKDESLKTIPVVVLTTSNADTDVIKSYELGCNCYATKPVGFKEFCGIIKEIEEFWFTIVKLPQHQK